jgi:hypothetical protein
MKNRSGICLRKRKASLYSLMGAAFLGFRVFDSERIRNSSPGMQARLRFIPLLSETELIVNVVLIVLLIVAAILLSIFTHRWQGGCTCLDCGKRRFKDLVNKRDDKR